MRYGGFTFAFVGVLILSLSFFLEVESKTIELGVLLFIASLILVPLSFVLRPGKVSRQAFERLSKLFEEVEKHNKIVKDIHVLDQLRKAGNPVGLSDREQVLEALRLTRDHLVRAFKTECILRKYPDFKREQFRIDLTAYHALQVSEQASDYGQFLDAALQIGVEVQEEMIKLLEDRTSE